MVRDVSGRFRLILMCLMMAAPSPAWAAGWDYAHSEFIVVSGGPAARRWEDLRVKPDRHDQWWGNFIRSARIRIQQIRRAHGDAAQITWMVYRPAYERRVGEDAVRSADQPCTIDKILSVRDAYHLKLVWFYSGDEVISYINSRSPRSIVDLEYFGHSNRDCFMFDYSCEISGASASFLHESQCARLKGYPFARSATCRSWGCHTGESMSRYWKKATGVPLEGVVGKTDYSVIIDHVSLPRLSPGARWTH
jgi:hypothetical protein